MILALSSLQSHAAEFVHDLAWVYTVAIIAYVISSLSSRSDCASRIRAGPMRC